FPSANRDIGRLWQLFSGGAVFLRESSIALTWGNSIDARRRVVKQRGALRGGIVLGQPLECIPEGDVTVRLALHRKIAFEETAVRPEFLDAPFEIRFQSRR